jgi:hypothetical protein
MSIARALFAFALFTPVLGFTGSKFVVSAVLGQSPQTAVAPGAAVAAVPTEVMVPISTPSPATPTPISTTVPAATATAATSPTPSSTAGVVTLARYWLGQNTAHPGDTLSVRYAVDNNTGLQIQVALGISMKASTVPSWDAAIADPSHDVTAIIAPGHSTHERYFTIPAGVAPGWYDVAWGLRDAAGQQLALESTPAVLHVVK